MTDDLDGLVERLQAPIRIVGTTSEDACEIYDDLRLDAAAAIMRLRGENERLIRINKDHCSAVNTYILSCIKLETNSPPPRPNWRRRGRRLDRLQNVNLTMSWKIMRKCLAALQRATFAAPAPSWRSPMPEEIPIAFGWLVALLAGLSLYLDGRVHW